MSVAAVLLDMDGTLVDSEGAWWQATVDTAREHGVELAPEDAVHVTGRSTGDIAGWLEGRGAPAGLAPAIDGRLLGRLAGDLRVIPGALELLDLLARHGVPTALVSASPRAVVDVVVDRLGRHLFTTSVAAEDTVWTKPSPDPYLAAAAQLSVRPGDCVAIEDSPTGVASATAAGVGVIVVGAGTTVADLDLEQLAAARLPEA